MAPRRRRPDGRRKPRIRVNVVYRTIQASGGPKAVCEQLGVSLSRLAVWRRRGRLTDARTVLEWVALLHPSDAVAAYQLARRLAGLAPAPPPR
jgi:hypothetical protein